VGFDLDLTVVSGVDRARVALVDLEFVRPVLEGRGADHIVHVDHRPDRAVRRALIDKRARVDSADLRGWVEQHRVGGDQRRRVDYGARAERHAVQRAADRMHSDAAGDLRAFVECQRLARTHCEVIRRAAAAEPPASKMPVAFSEPGSLLAMMITSRVMSWPQDSRLRSARQAIPPAPAQIWGRT
jgi:hypothetical protein